MDIGANIFVGNLDPDCDDKLLYDTFAAFGPVISAKCMRDPDNGEPRGFGFVSFDSFEAADHGTEHPCPVLLPCPSPDTVAAAIASMNEQWFMNRNIRVTYAYKKDGAPGERHGTDAGKTVYCAAQSIG